jgi:hypothetical protein
MAGMSTHCCDRMGRVSLRLAFDPGAARIGDAEKGIIVQDLNAILEMARHQ